MSEIVELVEEIFEKANFVANISIVLPQADSEEIDYEEVVDLLNEQEERIKELEKENKWLKQEQCGIIENDFCIEYPKCGAVPEYWLYEEDKVLCPNCDTMIDGDVDD